MPSASLAFPQLYGYPLQLWTSMYSTLSYASTTLNAATSVTALSLSEACAQTFLNALNGLDAYLMSAAALNAYNILAPAVSTVSGLTSAQLLFVQNRLAALYQFSQAAAALQAAPVVSVSNTLASGNPAVPYMDLVTLLVNFTVGSTQYASEVPPTGLTAATFAAQASASASAWLQFYTLLLAANQGSAATLAYAMYSATAQASSNLANISVNSTASSAQLSYYWGSVFSQPVLAAFTMGIGSNPISAFYQQFSVVKLLATQMLYEFNVLVVNLLKQVPNNVQTYTVRYNDTLLSIASSQLGDYTQWQSIANLNGLLPPYVSNTYLSSQVATPGTQIYLPTNGAVTAVPPAQNAASYETSFLGYDIYYGPINENMLPWTGDFLSVSGYQNLAFSLGRRLQTPLGNLVYHNDFGSRVPYEIGNIVTQETVPVMAAYAESSVLSDPRVQSIVSSSATALENQGVAVSVTVLPAGQTAAVSTTQNFGVQ